MSSCCQMAVTEWARHKRLNVLKILRLTPDGFGIQKPSNPYGVKVIHSTALKLNQTQIAFAVKVDSMPFPPRSHYCLLAYSSQRRKLKNIELGLGWGWSQSRAWLFWARSSGKTKSTLGEFRGPRRSRANCARQQLGFFNSEIPCQLTV